MAEEQNKQPPDTQPKPPDSQPPAGTGEDASLDQESPAAGDSKPAPETADAAKTDAAPAAASSDEPEPSNSSKDRLRSALNIYFFVYIGIVLMAIGIIIFAVNASRKATKTNTQKVPSLTSQQLSQLKGNTTIVGDSKQTLDVQSNSVFEGQVLVRSDLSVSGAIKVGSSLSLPSISVGNAGIFGSVQVSNDLSVNGNTTLQGTLAVQKNLSVAGLASFGNLSVGALSVTSLQLTGDLTVSRHIVTNGSLVSRTPGGALGGGGTVSVSGTDTAGTITVNTGNSPPPGIFVTINFANKFASVPRVLISPVGVQAGAITYYIDRTPTGFSVGCTSAPPAGASFSFDYFVIE
ncbi:MAG TPA: hypothetical protein VMT23_00840 [Candidatus Binatia bacterium]|nr:hypothetical protein [Candidatus Binatia bacterium]